MGILIFPTHDVVKDHSGVLTGRHLFFVRPPGAKAPGYFRSPLWGLVIMCSLTHRLRSGLVLALLRNCVFHLSGWFELRGIDAADRNGWFAWTAGGGCAYIFRGGRGRLLLV